MAIRNVVIPERLDALLGQSGLGHAVRLSLLDFEEWIDGSTGGLFFFPEYTDHGPRHVSAVLTAAEALIWPGAWRHLTSEDAAVLVLASLLHDSAMHLSGDGLLDLIGPQGKRDRQLLYPLDSKTWPELFDQFYLEARRWDQRELHRLLGDHARAREEEDLVQYIRHPIREQPNCEDWSLRYRKFLGEFVRRHHARLAHEIALCGVPGTPANRVRLTRVPAACADLAGLVARSHNMHLRDTFPYLREKYYGRVECANSHPVFLMVLLRIADYLEIRTDRVNPTRLRIQRLRSPISQEEWSAHLAVHEVRPDEDDREAVFVIARPGTVRTFLKIKALLSGLQLELDTSWAVLGEVFSKQGDLAQLGLTLRRVRSNLDDLTGFIQSERPPYIPIRAAFDTAGVDLLKLLIRPLYGERPEIGIRELLQNSLDAVHELRQWAAQNGDPEVKVSLPTHDADVLITIDRDPKGYWLTISDKGIGMTAETVRDFFLMAGASYRQSETWRRTFEDEGRAKILRSGRFGVGALAAFLLGNRIEVSTRYAAAPASEGLRFSASIEDDVVELRWEERDNVGTTIRVKLTPQALKVLKSSMEQHDWTNVDSMRRRHPWDWYVLEDPKVERRFNGVPIRQQYSTPSPDAKVLPLDWKSVRVDGYQTVLWTYSEAPELTCNGIRIESYRRESQRKKQRQKMLGSQFTIVKRPSVSVFDRDGMLPLNLLRSEIETEELPFSAELFKDVIADLYAFLLVHGPQDVESVERWILSRATPFEPLVHYDKGLEIERFWVTQEGFALADPWHLAKSALTQGVLVLSEGYGPIGPSLASIPKKGAIFFGRSTSFTLRPTIGLAKHVLRDFGLKNYNVLRTHSRRVSARKGRYKGDVASNDIPFDEFTAPEPGRKRSVSLVEMEIDPLLIKVAKSPMVDFLEEFVDTAIIPFDPEERRRKLPRCFEMLRGSIETWRARDLKGWREELVKKQ